MCNLEKKSGDKKPPIVKQIIDFHDDLTKFNEYCGFLCDAFAGIVAHNDMLDSNSTSGFEHNAHWLKNRANKLREKFKGIKEQALIQEHPDL